MQISTHIARPHKPNLKPKLGNECAFTLPGRNSFFFFPPFGVLFFAYVQPLTDRHFDSSERKQKVVQPDTDDKTPSANSVYVAIAGEVVNRRSVLLRNFVLIGQERASNPLLHIHAECYTQLVAYYRRNKK